MRIDRLVLGAFGPFTDKVLDFSGRPGALQLVYGPNEAGKSSTLRAVLGLLYGIPARTGDAHTHEQTKLRIGGTLVDEAGRSLSVVRRKGNKNTLAAPDGTLIAESALSGMLGGLNEELFTHMFGLDHVRLREGAEALLRGGGQLGEVLFDASMGGRGVHTLIENLRAEADAIYKQRGRTPELNAALESLRDKKKLKTDAVLSPQAFVLQQEALADKTAERAQALEARHKLAAEKSRLAQLLLLLPVIARRDAAAGELAKLPVLGGEGEGQAYEAAALEESVRVLNRRYGSVQSAEREEPARRAELATLERDVEDLRARLGGAEGLLQLGSDVDAPRALAAGGVETARRTRLRKLVEVERGLLREHAELTRSHAAASEQHARVVTRLAAYGERAPSTLLELIAEVERDDLPGQLSRSDAELTKLEAQLVRRVAQLGKQVDFEQLAGSEADRAATGRQGVRLGALARCALPGDAVLSELEGAHEQHARELARLAHAREQGGEELARLERARGELLAFGEPATREELEASRARRDRAFDALFTGASPTSAEQAALVRAYSAAVQHADELADRMTREAKQAAELRRVDQLLAQQRAQLVELTARVAHETAAAEKTEARFRALVAPLGVGACTPRGARPLLAELSALRALVVQRDELELHVDTLSARASERSCQLRAALALSSESVEGAAEHKLDGAVALQAAAARGALEQQLRQARVEVARASEQTREQAALEAQLDKLLAEQSAQHARLSVVEREQATSRAAYTRELAQLGLTDPERVDKLAPEELLSCLDELTQLGQRTRELGALRARLEAARLEREALSQAVREASVRFLSEAFVAEHQRSLEAALTELSRVQRERSEARRDQVRLCSELHTLDEQLALLGDGAPLEELRTAVRALSPHEGRARVEEIDVLLEEQSHRTSDLEQAIGRLSLGLETLEKVSGAVELAEDYEHELTRARGLSRRYIELKLALSLLSSEVERYRAQHQQPVLKRASELFPRLTLNRYRGLSVEYDEQDEPVLSCLLHGGRSVRVNGLSDGTRDQLYLALRVASIERYFEGRPPLPLILDDALVHFDDVRAAAALEVLGELTKHTQVLFFTHHARMVDLAQSALGEHRLQVHALSPREAPRSDGPLFDISLS